jgi:hypothetical protein
VQVEEFGALFERFERSAFRIEARDRYDVENERDQFAAFSRGSLCRLDLLRSIRGCRS